MCTFSNSIVSTRDLTGRWIGITLSEYGKYIDGKYHENTTYIPWDETDTFNRNLSGVMCTQFQVVEWNVCYDGIYYKTKRVAVWTDETGLQLTSSN
ncbi:hypothetical protein FGIG_03795 [Fasciola gigantica]|uniref:Uncharacterized protein n=1 Tax=Fasciola gigantica TaxID=46835 RepID=A0A504YPG0_FASGI|nr:hypothetical protein FGIG_03795 [Fasciola gigantica]